MLEHSPSTTPRTGCGAVPRLVLIGLALETARLEAYIDPGTGSYVFQLAIAGALAALYAVKHYWRRTVFAIKALWKRSRAAARRGSVNDRGELD